MPSAGALLRRRAAAIGCAAVVAAAAAAAAAPAASGSSQSPEPGPRYAPNWAIFDDPPLAEARQRAGDAGKVTGPDSFAAQITIDGDASLIDGVFASRAPEFLAGGFAWTEGPLWVQEKGFLVFSDTIQNKMFSLTPGGSPAVDVLSDDSGGCDTKRVPGSSTPTPGCHDGQLEPGSNGIAFPVTGTDHTRLLVCQHGGRRVAEYNLHERKFISTVTETGHPPGRHHRQDGHRLNSPNDVVATPTAVFFTDPVYGVGLEKARPYDDPYIDEKSELGFEGVWEQQVSYAEGRDNPIGPPRLIDRYHRPNGIALTPDGTMLYTSQCCQGVLCEKGHVSWRAYKRRTGKRVPSFTGPPRHVINATFPHEPPGCADGFKLSSNGDFIVSSCPLGVCVVRLSDRAVARLRLNMVISNVAFSPGHAYLTGWKSVWRLPLTRGGAVSGADEL